MYIQIDTCSCWYIFIVIVMCFWSNVVTTSYVTIEQLVIQTSGGKFMYVAHGQKDNLQKERISNPYREKQG